MRFLIFFISFAIFANNIEKINVIPKEIKLKSARSSAQILVTGITTKGQTIDLSRDAEFKHNHIIKIEDAYVTPLANGSGYIDISYGKHKQRIKLTVQDTDKSDPISFNWMWISNNSSFTDIFMFIYSTFNFSSA